MLRLTSDGPPVATSRVAGASLAKFLLVALAERSSPLVVIAFLLPWPSFLAMLFPTLVALLVAIFFFSAAVFLGAVIILDDIFLGDIFLGDIFMAAKFLGKAVCSAEDVLLVRLFKCN